MKETDTYYIDRCQDGHPDDYRFLVQRYQGALLGHLLGRLGCRERAEEVTQESLVRAYFKIGSLEQPDRFFAWLLGIANRVVQEHQRHSQRTQRHRDIPRQPCPTSPADSYDEDLATAIAQLPDQQRDLILLRYYSQMSCKDISQHLDMPLGTVTKTLSRAYSLLRQFLSQSNSTDNEVVR